MTQTTTSPRLISVGECMVELARGAAGDFHLSYGGDTFNSAVYAARLGGIAVTYATALGDDPYSDGIAARAREEGIGTDLIVRCKGRMPGLYLIETTDGERSFWYWRERAAARDFFEVVDEAALTRAFAGAAVVYLSGVTLSLYSERGLGIFERHLRAAKASGTSVAMDSNYRPRGWPTGPASARPVFERFWRLADVALPTFDDEQALWEDGAPSDTIARLAALGVPEIVVKTGPDGAHVAHDGRTRHVPCPIRVTPVDTTAAGDAFNAGYLTARLRGLEPDAAALIAHRLAGIVIGHRGAIAPADAIAPLAAELADLTRG